MSILNLHQLRTFVAVSRHGNVAKAAEALQLTASPVSRALRQLERTVGVLFERGYHDMQLSEAGHRLLPTAVSIVQQADDLLVLARGEAVTIRFAATPWVPARFARELTAAAEHAGPSRDVDAAVSSVLVHRMIHGEIDVALVHLPVDVPYIATMPIARYAFHLAVPSDDPLAARPEIRRDDLAGRRVLLFPSSMHQEAMSRMRAWFEDCGVATISEITLADVPSLSARLRRERAVTVNAPDPESPILHSAEITTVPFRENPVEFELGIAWRSGDVPRRERLEAVVEALRRPDGAMTVIGGTRPAVAR
jgi:DNA-binding transcriptional LysR family regulator